MNNKADRNGDVEKPKGENGAGPGAGEPVWVRCKDFRTMAFRDGEGVWRSFGNGKKLEGPVEVEG